MTNNKQKKQTRNELIDNIPAFISRMTFHCEWLKQLMPKHKSILDNKEYSYEIQKDIAKLQESLKQRLDQAGEDLEWKKLVARDTSDYKKSPNECSNKILGARLVIRTLIDILPECISKIVDYPDNKVGLLLFYRPCPESEDIILTEDVLLSGCDTDNPTKANKDWIEILSVNEEINSTYVVNRKTIKPWEDVEKAALESASSALTAVEEPSSPMSQIVKTSAGVMDKKRAEVKIISSNPPCIAVPYESPSGLFNAVHFSTYEDDSDLNKVKLAAMLLAALNLMDSVIQFETKILSINLEPLHQRPLSHKFLPYSDTVRELIDEIYYLWRPDELAFGRQSGPFAEYLGLFSLKKGKWDLNGKASSFNLWNSGEFRENGKSYGYVIRAITRKESYFVPDTYSKNKRDNLVPRDIFDSSVQFLRSQYSIPISYKREFTGAVNIGFAQKKSGLWQYELKLITEYIERVVEWLIEHYRDIDKKLEKQVMSDYITLMQSIIREGDQNKKFTINQSYCLAMLQQQFGLKHVEYKKSIETAVSDVIKDAVGSFRKNVNEVWKRESVKCNVVYLGENLKKLALKLQQYQFSSLLQCLLMNAYESTLKQDNKSTKSLLVQISKAEWPYPDNVEGIEIGIYDTGPSIEDYHKLNIFEHSYTTKGAPNLGVGLWYVDQVCRTYGYLLEYRHDIDKTPYSKAFCILIPYVSRGI